MYIVVSVGNTDNKQEWHQFTWDIDFELRQYNQDSAFVMIGEGLFL